MFYTNRFNDVAEELDNAHVTYYTKWKDLGPLDRPQRAALSKAWSKKKSTRIRQVPAIAPILARACEIFTERTQQRLDYQAETSGVLMLRALECILITKRLDAPKEHKETLWITQGGKCAECGDLLGMSLESAKYDVAHKRVRHQSIGDEGNHTSNLELKCRPCHTRETEQQDAATRSHGHTLASHPSPLVAEWFKISGKPRQQTGGVKCSGDDIYRLDARGSRPNAIWEYPYRLPIFSPIDEPERCLGDDGSWVRNP